MSQIFDIILKAIIWKTTTSSTMKLNSLGVEHHKFILGSISEVFNMYITCDTAHIKSVVELLPNTLYHVSGNLIQCGIDSLIEFINASRKRGGHRRSINISP